MASNRIGRINEEIQKELSALLRNLKDPRVQNTMISITHVQTTPDLRYAKIYVMNFKLFDRSVGCAVAYKSLRQNRDSESCFG
jgi:ribosome-binding factor A